MQKKVDTSRASPAPVTGRTSPLQGLKEKLSKRPDSEHEQALIRVVLVFIALLYLIYYTGKDGLVENHELFAVEYVGGYLIFSILLFLSIIIQPEKVSRARKLIGMVGDIGGSVVVMYLTGEDASPYFIVLLWVTFGNGFRYGNSYLFASTVLSVSAFGVMVTQNGYWKTHTALAGGLLMGLIVLPAYVSTLLKKLNEAIKKAEEANEAKSRFLANMSHEMRTPLNGILGIAALLRDTPLSSEQEDHATTIEASAETLLSLIEDVLDISKIEAGKYVIESVDFDIHSFIKSTTAMVEPVARNKGLTLTTFLSPKIPFLLRGDQLQLRKIFLNLLGNAVKFTDKGGVTLRGELLKETPEMVSIRFEVSDTGIGIGQDAQAKIFERFTQADNSISRRFGGTGLGTTIVKQLIDLMGGDIGLTSEPGKGSTFWFSLPLEKQQGNALQVAGTSHLLKSRILIISSDPEISEILQGYISSWGAHAFSVDRAAQAFALLVTSAGRQKGFHIALVVESGLDMDLFEFSKGIKSDETVQNVKLLLAGKESEKHDLNEIISHGYSAAIPTPIDKTLLYNALHFLNADTKERKGIATITERYAQKSGNPRGISILVAEDNPTNQKVIAKILEHAGYKVVLVENGEEALDALENHSFQVALLDLQMPVMGGVEAAKIYRMSNTRGSRIPLIALTADATEQTRESCEEAGMAGFLTKPINVENILHLIESVVPGEEIPQSNAQMLLTRRSNSREKGDTKKGTILDLSVIEELQLLGGNCDFVGKTIQTFLKSSEQMLWKMKRSVAIRDVDSFQNLTHTLKGSAGQIGAMTLMEECEKGSQISPMEFREQGGKIVIALEEEFIKAKTALLQYLEKKGYAAS